MRSRLSVRRHARLTGFVLTLGAALAFPRAITAQPQSPETPRAAEVVERVPLYFEPLPDGSFLARRIGRTIRISGADIHISQTPASGVESSGPIGIRFAGARRGLSVEGISQQRGRVNYLLGNDPGKWRTNVRTYARASAISIQGSTSSTTGPDRTWSTTSPSSPARIRDRSGSPSPDHLARRLR